MTINNCPKCETEMYIDTWNGWFWKCPACGYYGRVATQDEADQQEREAEEYFHGLNNC
jgi:DNA-directed RNA polymerase subunit M/transcription elongation factor TFIIS